MHFLLSFFPSFHALFTTFVVRKHAAKKERENKMLREALYRSVGRSTRIHISFTVLFFPPRSALCVLLGMVYVDDTRRSFAFRKGRIFPEDRYNVRVIYTYL